MLELEVLAAAAFNVDSNRRGDISESEAVSESLGEILILSAAFALSSLVKIFIEISGSDTVFKSLAEHAG